MVRDFGRPPFLPLAWAAAIFAGVRALPPLRPSSTAAGFLRRFRVGITVDVLLSQGWHAPQRQTGEFQRQGLEGRVVASGERGIPAGHQVAAGGVHAPNIPSAWVHVKWLKQAVK